MIYSLDRVVLMLNPPCKTGQKQGKLGGLLYITANKVKSEIIGDK